MRTGSDYLQTLRERKSVTFIGGEQVNDVTTHPAFANAAQNGGEPLRRVIEPSERRQTHL